jgi:hypothetical protein
MQPSYFLYCLSNEQFDRLLSSNYAKHHNKSQTYSEIPTHSEVLSWSTVMRRQHWRLMADIIVGKNGDFGDPSQQGYYWGINITPSIWIIQDKLEAVFRYQYAEAERRNGFRISAHSIRRIADQEGANINEGYGDKHQSAYAGINYYLCGDNTKIMAGIQWDDLQSKNQQIYEGDLGGTSNLILTIAVKQSPFAMGCSGN